MANFCSRRRRRQIPCVWFRVAKINSSQPGRAAPARRNSDGGFIHLFTALLVTTCRIKRHAVVPARSVGRARTHAHTHTHTAVMKKYLTVTRRDRDARAFVTCANHVRVLNTRDVPSRRILERSSATETARAVVHSLRFGCHGKEPPGKRAAPRRGESMRARAKVKPTEGEWQRVTPARALARSLARGLNGEKAVPRGR